MEIDLAKNREEPTYLANNIVAPEAIAGTSGFKSDFVTPEQFRPSLKAEPRTNKRKPRKL